MWTSRKGASKEFEVRFETEMEISLKGGRAAITYINRGGDNTISVRAVSRIGEGR